MTELGCIEIKSKHSSVSCAIFKMDLLALHVATWCPLRSMLVTSALETCRFFNVTEEACGGLVEQTEENPSRCVNDSSSMSLGNSLNYLATQPCHIDNQHVYMRDSN